MTAPLPPLDPLLGLDGVHSYYGDSHILHGVSLSLARGRVLTLLGRNGAGKTTLLKSVIGIVVPRTGRIVFDGDDMIGLSPSDETAAAPRFPAASNRCSRWRARS